MFKDKLTPHLIKCSQSFGEKKLVTHVRTRSLVSYRVARKNQDGIYPILKMTYLLDMLKVQTHFCKYKGAEIKVKQFGTPDFKTLIFKHL